MSYWHPTAVWSCSMLPAEQDYARGDQEILATVMSCCRWHYYLEGTRHPGEVFTDHCNIQSFMTTMLLTGRQKHKWEILLDYNLNIVYGAGKENPAIAPSCLPNFVRLHEKCCGATTFTVGCSATFCLQQLYATTAQKCQIFQNVPSNTLCNLIQEVWQKIILLLRLALHQASTRACQLINLVFQSHCFESTRATSSSTTVSSITKCCYTLKLLDELV